MYGKRDPVGPSFLTAINGASIAVIAIPFTACPAVLPTLAQALRGKIVIDATNPLNADYSPLVLAEGRSAAEEIADMLPQSRVVKAFNAFADNMIAQRLLRRDMRLTTFLSGDDEIRPLAAARYLEAMTHLLIAHAFGMGRGTDRAFIFSTSLEH